MNDQINNGEDKTTDELRSVYSDRVVEHATNPRNVGQLTNADGYSSVTGPCGDNMERWLKVKDDRIEGISFWTDGCSTTIACGSAATELAAGRVVREVLGINAKKIVGYIGGLVGPWLGGYILDITGNLNLNLIIMVVLAVVGVYLALRMPETGVRAGLRK